MNVAEAYARERSVQRTADALGMTYDRCHRQLKKAGVRCGPGAPMRDGKWHLSYITPLVCQALNVSMDRLISRSRRRYIVYARFISFYVAHKHGDSSLPCIGAYFGMDHTSVLHGVRTAEKLLEKPVYQIAVAAVLSRLPEPE